jgi:hypothetical protein
VSAVCLFKLPGLWSNIFKIVFTIPAVPRTKGNNRSIFWQFPQNKEQRETTGGQSKSVYRNRQHNGQKKKYKRTNNDLHNIHIKLNILLLFLKERLRTPKGKRESVMRRTDSTNNFLSTNDKGKQPEYILTISLVPRTKGNDRSIFLQFHQF